MPKNTWSNYKRSGVWVDPPRPVFSKFPHFPFFFGRRPLTYEILPWVSTRGCNAPESVASEDRGGGWLVPEFDIKEDID